MSTRERLDGFGKKATGSDRGGHRPRRVGLWNMGYLVVPCVLFLSVQAALGNDGFDGPGKHAVTPLDAGLGRIDHGGSGGYCVTTEDRGGIPDECEGCIVWAENFDDGDVGDWTIENPYQPGDNPVTIEPSTEQFVSPDYSFKVSGPYQDFYGGMAAGPTVPVDLDRPFTIRFSFRYESFHWFRFCRFGPVSLVMDKLFLPLLAHVGPGAYLLIGFDDFWEYCPAGAWHDFRIEVHPPSRTFDVYVNDAFIGTADYGDHDTGLRAFHFYEGGGDAPAEPNYVANAYYDNVAVTQGPCEDCNENGVPDEVDIAFGTSEDGDGNGIPDECEDVPAEEGLVAYWCFDDCTPADCSGHGLNGTNYGAACVDGPEGYGSAYEFTDTDIVRSIPNSWDNSISTAFTVAAWVKWYGPASHGRSMVIFDGRDDSWDHAGFWFGLSTAGNVYLHMNQSDSTILGVSTVPSDAESTAHVAVVFDGTADELRAYVNGQQDNTVSTAAVYRNSSHRPAIGNNHWAPGDHEWATFNGVIDELRIYDRALSAAEIQQLAGGAEPSDCNGNGIADECDLDCGEEGGLCDVPGCGLSEDCNDNGIPDECDIAEGTSEDCQPNGVPDECDIAGIPPALAEGLVGYWSFDEGTGTVAHDGSGYTNDLTIHGATWSPGVLGSALDLDWGNYLRGATANGVGSKFISVSLWASFESFQKETQFLYVRSPGSDALQQRYFYFSTRYRHDPPHDGIHIGVLTNDGIWGPRVVSAPDIFLLSRWYHIVGIVDTVAGTLRVYRNAELIAQASTETGDIPGAPYEIWMGKTPEGYQATDALFDEVRIYNRALNAQDVWALYRVETSADCNENGVPDECDIAEGTSEDRNGNGIPDECEPPFCTATRNLSDSGSWYCPGMPKTVHVLLDAPVDTFAVGVEESPPDGWTVSVLRTPFE